VPEHDRARADRVRPISERDVLVTACCERVLRLRGQPILDRERARVVVRAELLDERPASPAGDAWRLTAACGDIPK
jgi:hypothetical protein